MLLNKNNIVSKTNKKSLIWWRLNFRKEERFHHKMKTDIREKRCYIVHYLSYRLGFAI